MTNPASGWAACVLLTIGACAKPAPVASAPNENGASEPTVLEEPLDAAPQQRRGPACDPIDPCGAPMGKGMLCGEMDSGCPNTTAYCSCRPGLICQDRTCIELGDEILLEAFVRCGDSSRLGQAADVPGTTCSLACNAHGFDGCSHRVGQAGFETCKEQQQRSGGCEDVFGPGWSTECVCD